MKKIAVLIPTFEPGEYIESCLASLDNQTLSRELYCVYIALNGPRHLYEENLLNKLLKYKNFCYKYFYIEQAGVSNARNHLIDFSSEEFIVFIDDDDQVSNTYLKELYDVSNDNYMGISNIYNFERSLDVLKDNYMGKSFLGIEDGEVCKFKTRKYFSSPCAKAISRNMIGNVRFDTYLSNGEDSLFMASISNNILGVKKTTPKACYFVYERTGSASRKKVESLVEIKRVFYLINKYLFLFFSAGYSKLFILTRVAATVRHLTRLFF